MRRRAPNERPDMQTSARSKRTNQTSGDPTYSPCHEFRKLWYRSTPHVHTLGVTADVNKKKQKNEPRASCIRVSNERPDTQTSDESHKLPTHLALRGVWCRSRQCNLSSPPLFAAAPQQRETQREHPNNGHNTTKNARLEVNHKKHETHHNAHVVCGMSGGIPQAEWLCNSRVLRELSRTCVV